MNRVGPRHHAGVGVDLPELSRTVWCFQQEQVYQVGPDHVGSCMSVMRGPAIFGDSGIIDTIGLHFPLRSLHRESEVPIAVPGATVAVPTASVAIFKTLDLFPIGFSVRNRTPRILELQNRSLSCGLTGREPGPQYIWAMDQGPSISRPWTRSLGSLGHTPSP